MENFKIDVDSDGRFTRFAIEQGGAAPGAGETRVHRLAIGIYDDDPAGSPKLVRVYREEVDVDGESTDIPALQGISRGKLILVNDDDLTYCSLRLDTESLETLLERIADIAEPLPRTLAWSAAWEMTRDAELRARDFVALVQRGIGAETEVGVAQRLLLQAQTALGSYAEPGWAREQGWPGFADRLAALAHEADAGSADYGAPDIGLRMDRDGASADLHGIRFGGKRIATLQNAYPRRAFSDQRHFGNDRYRHCQPDLCPPTDALGSRRIGHDE